MKIEFSFLQGLSTIRYHRLADTDGGVESYSDKRLIQSRAFDAVQIRNASLVLLFLILTNTASWYLSQHFNQAKSLHHRTQYGQLHPRLQKKTRR